MCTTKFRYGCVSVCWLVLLLSGCQLILEDLKNPNGNSQENCGDGVIQRAEECDGANLASKTCSSLGFSGGTLTCTTGCTLDTSSCRSVSCAERSWKADVLFVIDSSLSMAEKQNKLKGAMSSFVYSLRNSENGLPNLHIGFITPDLGTSPYNIPGCELPGGDQGKFLKGFGNSCTNPTNQLFVVDVEPVGCTIAKNFDNPGNVTCETHDCATSNCPTVPAGLVFIEDSNGCPRCKNYSEQSLTEVLSCMASIGTIGCGMEQPLEGMYQALNMDLVENEDFLRSDAALVVVVVTDEDDCSAQNTELFNPAGDINSTLGGLSSFRCTEFGVVCDEPWQREMPEGQMTYSNCRPRESGDPKNMLHPISRYTENLKTLKGSQPIVLMAIAGPSTNYSLTVGEDANQYPKLQPSCGISTDGGDPAIRIRSFVESLTLSQDMSWAVYSICDASYGYPLIDLGEKIFDVLAECDGI